MRLNIPDCPVPCQPKINLPKSPKVEPLNKMELHEIRKMIMQAAERCRENRAVQCCKSPCPELRPTYVTKPPEDSWCKPHTDCQPIKQCKVINQGCQGCCDNTCTCKPAFTCNGCECREIRHCRAASCGCKAEGNTCNKDNITVTKDRCGGAKYVISLPNDKEDCGCTLDRVLRSFLFKSRG